MMEHEQINDKSVALSIRGAKMTANALAGAMRAFLKKAREPTVKHGEQSLKSLSKQGSSLADIEISGENIGSFKRIARKYNIDFALRKDATKDPPHWVVFFKAKDSKAIESAFKEYSAIELKHKKVKTPMLKRLEKFKELAKSILPPAKNRNRGEREL
jgi:translation initiation factor 2B subunit (eIF-2B alpha/beta/delta family)